MLIIGCHLSISKGFEHLGREALKIGANTFQFFSRNPRGGQAKTPKPGDLAALRDLLAEHRFGPVLAHAPYTVNPCSADPKLRDFARQVISSDLELLEALPGNLYNFHPGSHTGQGLEAGVEFIAEMLNKVLKPEQNTRVLLETMAGKGSEVGVRFEELKAIWDKVNLKERLGVCLDTCHIFDAGYDIVNNLEGVLAEFDQIIGLEHLYAIHLNDSLNPGGSHKDRHAKIGQGQIGLPALSRVINHPRLRERPFYLETPNDLAGYEAEIKLLRSAHHG